MHGTPYDGVNGCANHPKEAPAAGYCFPPEGVTMATVQVLERMFYYQTMGSSNNMGRTAEMACTFIQLDR
jgi:hypothetical protein